MAGVRFAPSPTGPFHIGNLRTAWVSWRLARAQKLPWVVRFEDIDEPRNAPGAKESQLGDMARLALVPDEIIIQSAARPRHLELFRKAVRERKVYPCFCSRKDVQDALAGAASAPHGQVPVYNGKCRGLTIATGPKDVSKLTSLAWRFRGDDESGSQDFIVARTSTKLTPNGEPDPVTFTPAYNWACAIDDVDGGYDIIVRAWDLDTVIEQQRAVQRWMKPEARLPAVYHTSLVVQDSGARLEKRTRGVMLTELFAAGETPETIATKFGRSFDSRLPGKILPAAVLGETKRELTMSELGFLQNG